MRTLAFLLSLAVVFTIPWEDAITIGEWGALTRVIGMFTAAVWLGSTLLDGKFRKLRPFHAAVFLFILWNSVSFFWSVNTEETVRHIETYIQLALLAWILWDLCTTPEALGGVLQAYILGAYVTVGSIITNYLAGREISPYDEGRYTGVGLNAVDLALILALGLPVAWYLATSANNGTKDRILKLLNFGYIPLSLFAMMLTGSRMALFAVVPIILYILGTAKRLKFSFRILILALLVGTLLALLTHTPQATLDRLATTGDSIAARDLGGRVKLWRGAMAAFLDHPLLGVGSGALRTSTLSGSVAHNTFLSVLAELGLNGLLLFAILLAIVVHQAINQPKWLSWLWLTVLAVWVIGASTLTWEYRKQTWLFLSLVVISANLFRGGDVVEGPLPPVEPLGLPNSSGI
jgi:O-antigen ligase